ncbi:type II secretion system F family protein [Porticoccaceae bacterium]|nr:type II secretion system F family protein [Porticoccaceae bacterium]
MKNFSFSAYDAKGIRSTGEIRAKSSDDARSDLSQKGWLVVSVDEKRELSLSFEGFSNKSISSDDLGYLTAELSLLLNSGITIDKGLAVLRRSANSGPLMLLLGKVHESVREGSSLANAMEAEDGVFSPLYINLVKLGESTASLPAVFARLAEDIKFQVELKSKVRQALVYPSIIMGVCVLCIVFIFNYIVPQMSGLFEGLTDIPFYTLLLLDMSDWMIKYQWFVLLAIILVFAGLNLATKSPSGSRRLDNALMQLPGLNNVLILIERIRFNTAITMMLESGIMIDRCLDLAVGSVRNGALAQGLDVAKERVKKGDALSDALSNSALYPDFLISLIEVGEESGQLAPVFGEISSRSRREFEAWVDKMTSMLEPLLILFMGGIVGGVVVVMLLSIVSVNDIGL